MNKPEAIAVLTDHLRSKGRSNHTIRAYCTDLEMYFDWVADNYSITDLSWHLRALENGVARKYITEMRATSGLSASSVQRRISAIRCFAKANGSPDPLAGYDGPKRTRPPAHPLPGLRDDLEAMVDHAATVEQKCMVALLGMVGCRIEEARTVRVSSVHYVKHQPYLRIKGKGDKQRDVPIAARPMELIQERINQLAMWVAMGADKAFGPDPLLVSYSDRGARAAYTAIGRRAGIETATHDARMTFGTMVYNVDKDIRAAQELLGHASIETTVGYTGVADRAKLAAVGAFS